MSNHQFQLHTDDAMIVRAVPLINGPDDPSPCVTIDVHDGDGANVASPDVVLFVYTAEQARRIEAAAHDARMMLERHRDGIPPGDAVTHPWHKRFAFRHDHTTV